MKNYIIILSNFSTRLVAVRIDSSIITDDDVGLMPITWFQTGLNK